jgi:hypothetical protein
MSILFSHAGFRALRWPVGMAVAGIAVALFIVAGSYWYWQFELANDQQSSRMQSVADSRLANARRELNDLRSSTENYQQLSARGMFLAEQRLDLIEAMQALKQRHKLLNLEYTVRAQRPLKLASGDYAAVAVRASRIHLTVRTVHDGDLVAFLDEFPRLQRGFFPLDRCVLKRADRGVIAAAGPMAPIAVATRPAANELTAACSLEWITLQDKRDSTVTTASAEKPL